jgi:hypothetical protein
MMAFIDKLRGALRSKTVWFNAVAIPVLLLILDQLQANLGLLAAYLPVDKMQTVGAVSIIGNIVLRAMTSSALEHK